MVEHQPDRYRPLTRGMRWFLYIAAGLVFIAGVQLFILSTQTDQYFAWTIAPPLTAAFLGATFWASGVLEILAARQRIWGNARIAVGAVLVFSTLMLLATLLHIDRFHSSPAAWAWIAVYVVVPPAMVVLLIQQVRAPGQDPPRFAPLPAWVRALLGIQAVVLVGVGILLFVDPGSTASIWPWELTPLTARAIASWLVGLGVIAAHVIWENDAIRVEPAGAAALALVGLQVLAVARYADTITWSDPAAWVYLIFVLSLLVVGAMLLLTGRQATRAALAH